MTEPEVRMTLGEHIEELRRRLIRSLISIAVGMVLCFAFGEYLMMLIQWPLAAATGGAAPRLKAFSLAEGFNVYFRVALLAGAILSSPYWLYQLWRFIAAGLYERERRAVRRMVAPSVVLLIVGVLFFIIVVAPLIIRFFIQFSQDNFPDPPNWGVAWYARHVLGDSPATVTTAPSAAAPAGGLEQVLNVSEYISLVALLSLAFGLAFQTPLVVYFLGRTGLVPVAAMRKARRYVFLVILIISAILTPPDVGSMTAMAVPMYLLYELGLLAAGRQKGRAAA